MLANGIILANVGRDIFIPLACNVTPSQILFVTLTTINIDSDSSGGSGDEQG